MGLLKNDWTEAIQEGAADLITERLMAEAEVSDEEKKKRFTTTEQLVLLILQTVQPAGAIALGIATLVSWFRETPAGKRTKLALYEALDPLNNESLKVGLFAVALELTMGAGTGYEPLKPSNGGDWLNTAWIAVPGLYGFGVTPNTGGPSMEQAPPIYGSEDINRGPATPTEAMEQAFSSMAFAVGAVVGVVGVFGVLLIMARAALAKG